MNTRSLGLQGSIHFGSADDPQAAIARFDLEMLREPRVHGPQLTAYPCRACVVGAYAGNEPLPMVGIRHVLDDDPWGQGHRDTLRGVAGELS